MTPSMTSPPPYPSKSHLRNPEHWLLFLAFLFVLAGAGPFLLSLVAPPPLTYPQLPLIVMQQEARPGDPLDLQVKRCNNESTPLEIISTRELYRLSDSLHVDVPAAGRVVVPGCHTDMVRFQLPQDVPPGMYRMQGIARVSGTYRQSNVFWFTTDFTIAP